MYIPISINQIVESRKQIPFGLVSIYCFTALMLFIPAFWIADLPTVIKDQITYFSTLIPSISKWIEYSTFKTNTQLYFVISWLLIPIQVVILFKYMSKLRRNDDYYRPSLSVLHLALIGITLLIVTAGWLIVMWNFAIVDSEPCRICVNTSRFSQAMMGGLFAFGDAFLITIVMLCARRIKDIILFNMGAR